MVYQLQWLMQSLLGLPAIQEWNNDTGPGVRHVVHALLPETSAHN